MRSVLPATTPRSWLTSSTAVPCSRCNSPSRSSTWSWTRASSAVVGSSAISTSGLFSSAIAIMTRCRMPPEKRCGWSSVRAAGMPTRSSIAAAFRRASARPAPGWCSRYISASCAPTVWKGLREVSASWKTRATRPPRTRRSTCSPAPTSSCPSSRIEPVTVVVRGSCRPSTASPVADLPEPDSPTRPRTSPRASSKDRPRTAWTGAPPRGSAKLTERSRTLSTGGSAAGAVAEEGVMGRAPGGRAAGGFSRGGCAGRARRSPDRPARRTARRSRRRAARRRPRPAGPGPRRPRWRTGPRRSARTPSR